MKACPAPAEKVTALAALAVAAGLLAACGSSATPSSRPTATVTVTVTAPSTQGTPAEPTAPAGPAGCATTALTAQMGPGNGAAGSTYYPLEFTNSSSVTCSLYGYPGVSFVTASGAQVGMAAVEDPTYPRQLVTLSPGRTVHAVLRVTDALNYPPSACQPATVNRLRIYPPGQTSPLYISFTATACLSTSVPILSVQTIQPGNG